VGAFDVVTLGADEACEVEASGDSVEGGPLRSDVAHADVASAISTPA
jgi:hypothetical protein